MQQLQRYWGRVSGPLLDRIDIHVEVLPVRYAELTADEPAEPSSVIRQRVDAQMVRCVHPSMLTLGGELEISRLSTFRWFAGLNT